MNSYHVLKRFAVALVVASIFSLPLLSLCLAASPPTQIPKKCRAFVNIKNDLYLVSATGTQIVRLTSDGLVKRFATLAPDGKLIAFMLDAEPNTFRVVSADGRRQGVYSAQYALDEPQTALSLYEDAPLIGISLRGADTIRLTKHIGPISSRFEFYRVPSDFSFHLTRRSRPASGEVCSIATNSDAVACVQGEDIFVNNNLVYSKDVPANASTLDAITLNVGRIESSKTYPSLKMQITSLNGGINLRVTFPDGTWQFARINSGGFMRVTVDDKTFYFVPTVANAQKGIVKIAIRAESAGSDKFDSVVAWRLSGNVLVVVDRSNHMTQLLFLGEKRSTGDRYIINRENLEISERIKDLEFVAPSILAFETDKRFGEIDLVHGKITDLPNMLNVNIDNVEIPSTILGWSCL